MKKTVQISFRVTERHARQLDQRRGGRSRADCARDLMVAGLEGQDAGQLLCCLAEIQAVLRDQQLEQQDDMSKLQCRIDESAEHLQGLREDLAMTVAGILVNLGQRLSKEQAEEFVRQTLLSNNDTRDE